jgi:hypothetical protein
MTAQIISVSPYINNPKKLFRRALLSAVLWLLKHYAGYGFFLSVDNEESYKFVHEGE